MNRPALLRERIGAIGESLQKSGAALALLGLGSIGKDAHRLDEYSDLDFFVIARPGMKTRFLESLDWLDSVSEPAFNFKNTVDGYKYLYQDGVFCEFAVFEVPELERIPFSEGKVIWKAEGFDESVCKPKKAGKLWRPQSFEWAMNEAMTCLYVGLCRYLRGERLSGTRFIQNYAVDQIVAALSTQDSGVVRDEDSFQHERRLERHYPELAKRLPMMVQGYSRAAESAREILKFIEEHHEPNASLRREIEKRIDEVLMVK